MFLSVFDDECISTKRNEQKTAGKIVPVSSSEKEITVDSRYLDFDYLE